MAIYGISGGIGSGKTMTLVYLAKLDLDKNRKIFTNVKFQNLSEKLLNKIDYLTAERFKEIFSLVKNGELNMVNSTVAMQEIHNYLDSRNSLSKVNKTLSYWILQSRHTGKGSCDIIYDTQNFDQIDKRLRRNTDFVLKPMIVEKEELTDEEGKLYTVPKKIQVQITGFVGQSIKTKYFIFDCSKIMNIYNTHELVEF